MKCPKYIEKALHDRARAAEKFLNLDLLISDWLDKNNIDCEYAHLHVETISNPYGTMDETLQDIKRA